MKQAALYCRVSKEEQVEGYSLDAQKRAFRKLTVERGWDIYREYVEEGRSAHTDDVRKRPVFKQAIEDATAGRYDVLVVHKIDRFSRKLRITLEYFEKLGKAGVGFFSILEQVDYSTPQGKFMLVMQGGLAELYSDNLGQEVKKGLHERRAQGLYLGLLPFGATKGEDGVPVRDLDTYPGLEMAFELASKGDSDRDVARTLNGKGYRTTGNRGPRPFTKDTVRGILTNRFYLGELTDGNGGWINGRHEPFVDIESFEQAQQMIARRRSIPKTTKRSANTYSLTGLLRCVYCKGPMWIHQNTRGRARIYCRERSKGSGCDGRGTFLDVYETQVSAYLHRFAIPEDCQARILELYRQLEHDQDDTERERAQLEGRLARIKKLYEWGDKPEAEYLSESRQIKEELAQLTPEDRRPDVLTHFELLLTDVSLAWEEASQEQRNRLARQLFDAVWIKDDRVVAVRPQPELRVFFQISEECQVESLSGDPDRIRTGDLNIDSVAIFTPVIMSREWQCTYNRQVMKTIFGL